MGDSGLFGLGRSGNEKTLFEDVIRHALATGRTFHTGGSAAADRVMAHQVIKKLGIAFGPRAQNDQLGGPDSERRRKTLDIGNLSVLGAWCDFRKQRVVQLETRQTR